jgi:hypothetical protein
MSRSPYRTGRLSTIDLLVKKVYFVKSKNIFLSLPLFLPLSAYLSHLPFHISHPSSLFPSLPSHSTSLLPTPCTSPSLPLSLPLTPSHSFSLSTSPSIPLSPPFYRSHSPLSTSLSILLFLHLSLPVSFHLLVPLPPSLHPSLHPSLSLLLSFYLSFLPSLSFHGPLLPEFDSILLISICPF